jgi:hypothetical protein
MVAWSPADTPDHLSAAIDGKTLFTYKVEGNEKMGNGVKKPLGRERSSFLQQK